MNECKKREYLKNVFPCLYYGIMCGVAVGAVIFLFKLAAKKAELVSRFLYSTAKENPIYIVCTFLVLAVCALAMCWLHKKAPEVRGGGIPRSEGVLRGVLSFRWARTLFGTFFGSVISFLCAVPVGSEGPAVLMGTSLGAMCGKASNNQTTWNRYIMTGGAGAGFAVATGAPLSGILFALEEIHKRFTPMLVLTVSSSVISATYINRLLCSAFGMDPNMLHIETLAGFELSHIGYLLLLGAMVALAVALFDSSIAFLTVFTKKHKKYLTAPLMMLTVFLATGALAFTFSDGVYSGHDAILEVAFESKTFSFLIILFIVRLLMMLLVTDSGATGGIFIPTLAIGAAFSAIASKILVLIGMPESLFATAVILGMCAFIGGTLRAPLTASILFIELTLQFSDFMYVALVVFAVSFITEIFNLTPFYDLALENMEHAQNEGRIASISNFEMTVSKGAFVVGKTVRDIMWPSSSTVISIKRADEIDEDTDNNGEKKLYAGDTVVLHAKYFDEEELKELLFGLVGRESEINKV